jgi:uncharacterized protein (DUF924 family)
MSKVSEILDFWFGKPQSSEYGKPREMWFRHDADFDARVRDRFLEVYQFAAAGLLYGWREAAESCLALIITLDQFPRNMFRGTSDAFATDDRALEIAKYAIELELDRELLPVQRWFMYLPFEHSENINDQLTAVQLFEGLKNDPASASAISFAQTHLNIIQTFGRFPHRNVILGRESTAAELEFLNQPDTFQG